MLWWLIQNLIVAAGLSAVVLVVCRTCRISPAGRHILWTIVLVKLVTPPLVFWPWPAPRLPGGDLSAASQTSSPGTANSTSQSVGAAAATKRPARSRLDSGESMVVHSETIVVPRAAVVAGSEPNSGQRKFPVEGDRTAARDAGVVSPEAVGRAAGMSNGGWWTRIAWRTTALVVWLTGSLMTLLVNTWRIVRMNWLARLATPAPEHLMRQVAARAGRIRIDPPPVRVSPRLASPVVWAAGRPLLLWPAEFVDAVESDAWQGVLVHELAHLKRRDHWVGRLELCAACLWWWCPLFWYVRYQVRENAELACDAWVVEAFPENRRAYAEALLQVSENRSRTSVPFAALGIGGGSRRQLERRLTMILREKVPFRASRRVVLAVVVLAFVALPGWTQPKPGETASDVAGDRPRSQRTSSPALSNPGIDFQERSQSQAKPGTPAKPGTTIAKNARRGRVVRPKESLASDVAVDQPTATAGKPRDEKPASRNELRRQLRQLKQEVDSLRQRNRRISQPAKSFREEYGANEVAAPPSRATVGTGTPIRATTVPRRTSNSAPDRRSSKEPVVATHTITLQRTTYRLPQGRAEALRTFLQKHVKAEVMQIDVARLAVRVQRKIPTLDPGIGPTTVHSTRMESVIKITTTPEAQKVIGQLIAIMRTDAVSSPMDATGWRPPSGTAPRSTSAAPRYVDPDFGETAAPRPNRSAKPAAQPRPRANQPRKVEPDATSPNASPPSLNPMGETRT